MTMTMTEPTIGEIVEIQSGYTSYVDLRLELFDDSRNIGRMSRYRPILSHRQAFQKLARSLRVQDKRCYLLTGSYGTGKSHLSLMFANYLQTPAAEPPMPRFFANYARDDPNGAEALKAGRSSGRYLVALCDWGGRGDFDEVVLRAVDEALERESFGGKLDTPYLQAAAKLDEWEQLARAGDPKARFLDDFERELSEQNPGLTLAGFKKRLAEFEYTALVEFKRTHQVVTTAPFTYDKADLLAILTTTLSSQRFKDRFLGLLILFDEFGDTMERGGMSPKAFQQFAQLCAETPRECAHLIFVGTAHKALTSYAKPYDTTDFRTASDRIDEVALTPDGVEDIIAAIVMPRKDSQLWRDQVAPRMADLDQLQKDCTRLKLFDWLPAPRVRKSIIENIYPMHPMATYALLQLARDVASNNRSIYKFFGGEVDQDNDQGSYGHYVATTPIVDRISGRLNLYTADLLCDYFAPALKADNRELRDTVREQIKDYENSLRELNRVAARAFEFRDDTLVPRILRLLLVYQIVGIPASLENLQFGLYHVTPAERDVLTNRLQALVTKGVLYFLKDTRVYEFKRSAGIDLDRLIDDYMQIQGHIPQNIVAELDELVPLDKAERYMEAKDYNAPYGEDKRLERRLVRAVDLGWEPAGAQGPRTYFDRLDQEMARETTRLKGEYEGLALHVVCETAEEIERARTFCARNVSDRIVVAIPKAPLLFRDLVIMLRALQSIQGSEDAKNFSTQDNAALETRLHGDRARPGAEGALRAQRDRLTNPREVIWLGKYAQAVHTEATKPYDAANRVMEVSYGTYHNMFAHEDFNKLRQRTDVAKNAALKEAVEKLLDYNTPLVIETSFAQSRGDRRYLEQCLLQNGALRQLKAEGGRLHCELDPDPDHYEGKLPSLAHMVCAVRDLGPTATLRLSSWVQQYRGGPYGQGAVALALALAYLRRQFGDSIRIKADDSAIGDLPMNGFERVLELINGQQYPNAYLAYRTLRTEERELVQQVYGIFAPVGLATVREHGVTEAYEALKSWWNGLPPLSKVAALYPAATHPYTADFIQVMQKIDVRDAHSFLFDDLPPAFGADAGAAVMADTVELVTAQLHIEKGQLEAALASVEGRIMDGVRILFNVDDDTYGDIVQGINAWYKGLDTGQNIVDPFVKTPKRWAKRKALTPLLS